MNNPWLSLTKTIVDRPGTPQALAPASAATRCERAGKRPYHRKLLTPPTPNKGQDHCPREFVDMAHAHAIVDNPWKLSPRQTQILDLLVQGLVPKEIGGLLDLSKSAISRYTTEMRARMKVDTNPQAVVMWHRYYRVLHMDVALADKDARLIENLHRAVEEIRAARMKKAA